MSDPEFRPDLYRGTAEFYDAFRIPYPSMLLDDLCTRARISGTGRLLDLACGTGQVAFALASRFAGVVALDQETEAIELARRKANRLGVGNVEWITGPAEAMEANCSFELVTIGNAFHRLARRQIAASATRWLVPNGCLALLWSNSPWDGSLPWQRALTDVMTDWTLKAGATDRVPKSLFAHLAAESHAEVLERAAFTIIGAFDFVEPHEWTVEGLTGFMASTSVLSHAALGPHVDAFKRDLRQRLLAVAPTGIFREDVSFSYTLARRR